MPFEMDDQQQPPTSGLRINKKFFPLAWILYFLKPSVSINGYSQKSTWGETVHPLPPGSYHVRVSYPYLFNKETSPGDLMVDIAPGQVISLKYSVPVLVFMKGKLVVSGA